MKEQKNMLNFINKKLSRKFYPKTVAKVSSKKLEILFLLQEIFLPLNYSIYLFLLGVLFVHLNGVGSAILLDKDESKIKRLINCPPTFKFL